MQEFKRVSVTINSTRNRKLVYGVGVNDSQYSVSAVIDGKKAMCPIYSKWRHMLGRCYDDGVQKKQPTYIGCTVCSDWLNFSSYLRWYDNNHIEGFDVDKDIKIKGNKHYSPNTCLFVSRGVNSLLTDCGSLRGDYPIGVSYRKDNGMFRSRVNSGDRSINLGQFDSAEKAHYAYKIAKNEQIRIAMNNNPDIAMYLEQHLYPLD